MNDQREHPSSSPPLMSVSQSRKLNLCNRHRSVGACVPETRSENSDGCNGRGQPRGVGLSVSSPGNATCQLSASTHEAPVFSHSLTHKAIPCLNDTYRTPPQQVMHTHGRPANISMPVTVRELRSHPVLRATLLAVLFEHLRGVALLGLVKRSC